MRITESQLRNIVRQEILRENVENRAAIAVLRKYNHPLSQGQGQHRSVLEHGKHFLS